MPLVKIRYAEIPPHLQNFQKIPLFSNSPEEYRKTCEVNLVKAIKENLVRWPLPSQDFQEAEIDLKPLENPLSPPSSQYDVSHLSFEMSQEDAYRINNEILKILRNPILVMRYLQDLDKELGEAMKESGIVVEDNSPQYYLAGFGKFVLGPCKENYQPFRKQKILHEILLRRERFCGINLDGVAIFAGAVNPVVANQFVATGNIFSEDERSGGNVLDHGKKTHRLQFEIFRQAVLNGDLNLQLSNGKILTQVELLEFIVKAVIKVEERESNIWQFALDNAGDGARSVFDRDFFYNLDGKQEEFFKTSNYSFSSRFPLTLKSLLTCFADKMGEDSLPNLCFYLRDSHYKIVMQNAQDVKSFCESMLALSPRMKTKYNINVEDVELVKRLPHDLLCSFITLYSQTPSYGNLNHVFNPNIALERDDGIFFQIRREKLKQVEEKYRGAEETRKKPAKPKSSPALLPSRYESFMPDSTKDGIVKKKETATDISVGRYSSWEDYLIQKKGKEDSRKFK